ncbi:MAG: Mov34/MPN/PAD-1 family protein [Candidatus Bathyarchaeia archaeon]
MKVKMLREAFDSILTYALTLHPREAILLLRGKVEKESITIREVLIPPLASHGRGFSIIPLAYLPIDFSIVGTVHSHPSGVLNPSVEDLNNTYGWIMMIVAHPYRGLEDVAVYSKDGSRLQLTIVGH